MDINAIRRSTLEYNIYTDGACSSNGTDEAVAGIGVYVEEDTSMSVSEPVPRSYKQTNQVAELMAVYRATEIGAVSRAVTIYSDSEYAVKAVNIWYYTWMNNGWRLKGGGEPKNLDLIREIRANIDAARRARCSMSLVKVKGHAGIPGNVAADELATKAVEIEIKRLACSAVDTIDVCTSSAYADVLGHVGVHSPHEDVAIAPLPVVSPVRTVPAPLNIRPHSGIATPRNVSSATSSSSRTLDVDYSPHMSTDDVLHVQACIRAIRNASDDIARSTRELDEIMGKYGQTFGDMQ